MKKIEGTWEEIADRAEELKDKRLQLTERADTQATLKVEESAETHRSEPNWAGLAMLERLEKMQAGMRETPGEDTLRIIREGRAGAMYGYEPIED